MIKEPQRNKKFESYSQYYSSKFVIHTFHTSYCTSKILKITIIIFASQSYSWFYLLNHLMIKRMIPSTIIIPNPISPALLTMGTAPGNTCGRRISSIKNTATPIKKDHLFKSQLLMCLFTTISFHYSSYCSLEITISPP